MHFSRSFLTTNSQQLVDQSSPDLFPRMQKESIWKSRFQILDILSRSGDIRDQRRRLYKIDRNVACIWPPNFLGGGLPEFLDLDYKMQTVSDYVAKFQGDRPRDLGERVAK